jgi:D-alanyl-D-alanine carboxypeptidase (penicillin-binding protein 5/6)
MQMRSRYRRPKKHTGLKFMCFILIIALAAMALNYVRPLPHATASVVSVTSELDALTIQWPLGASAIGAQGFGALAANGPQAPRPTASLAKIITALAVLEKQPLSHGEQGQPIVLTDADVALFEKYYRLGGAVVKVEVGKSLSEYQALQAILLPSANNMADTLAIWAFGSMEGYHTYANQMLKRMGLRDTVVAADASGMSPNTKSTPRDLIRLGEYALSHPVIAEIVAQPSAVIPIHGAIVSANSRLGYNNIIGIKTGLTDEAGGCFLFAAKHEVEGRPITIIGVIMGAKSLPVALAQSEPLLNSAKPYFGTKVVIKAGEVFATYATPWLVTSEVVAKQDVSLLAWKGTTLTPQIKLSEVNRSLPAGTQVGTALVASGTNTASTPLVLQQAITGPTWKWRFIRM